MAAADCAQELFPDLVNELMDIYSEDEEDDEDGVEEDDSDKEAGPNTSQYYVQRANQPLYPGCKVTVKQQCYVLMDEKQNFNGKDKEFDRLCRWVVESFQ